MASILDTVSAIIQQTLTPRVDYWMYENSPFFRRVFRDSSNVVRDQNWGRDWLVRKVFRTGLAGAFNFGRVGNQSVSLASSNSATPNFQIYGTTAQSVFPQPQRATSPAYFEWQIPLKKGIGAFYVPMEIMRSDANPSAIGQQLGAIVEGTAEKVAVNKCNAFFADSVTPTLADASTVTLEGVVLGVFTGGGNISSGTTTSPTATSITLTSGSVRRFYDGMEVDLIWNSGTGVLTRSTDASSETTVPVMVNKTDTLGDTLVLLNMSGSAINIGTNTVYITAHKAFGATVPVITNSTGSVTATAFATTITPGTGTTLVPDTPTGLEGVLKSSGQLYGALNAETSFSGIPLSRFPMMKSYIPTAIGSALDESILYKHIARYVHARGAMFSPDTFVASEGVFSGFVDNLDGYYTYDRNGRALDVEAGVLNDSIKFNAYGKTYDLITDPWLSAGKMYGLVTRNKNWKMHTPPRLPGAGSEGTFDAGIEFVRPLTGQKSIWGPTYNSSGQFTDMVGAEFFLPYQVVPEILPGIKLTGITESYGPLG